MYEKQLKESGLTKNQAEIYSALLKETKGTPASKLVGKVSLKRQMIYKVLNELEELGLCRKDTISASKTIFFPNSPSELADIINQRKIKVTMEEKSFSIIAEKMISEFNLNFGKPVVIFKEGLSGVSQMLDKTLSGNQKEIYTFVDSDSVLKYVKEIDKKHVEKRIEKKIYKKMLVVGKKKTKERLKKSKINKYTEIRFLKEVDKIEIPVAVEIYNNSVLYITFRDSVLTSTEITDNLIAKMNKYIFESAWETAEKL